MLSQILRSFLRFRKTTVSSLFVLTASFIVLVVFWGQNTYHGNLPVEEADKRLLDNAWHDLQVISEKPHPYTSHFNDEVHDYLLSKVKSLSNNVSFIEVSDDAQNQFSKLFKQRNVFNDSSTDTRLVYFESSNILTKVQGKNPKLPGLLLSAHFDSVPTANGATDDGKGVVSLLALLDYYSKNQPDRTIVFNINNNEEFGLLGATIFTYHRWFKLVSYVINLEGTGCGSKAVLFRTSDTVLASLYKYSVRDQPFGNSIYQQGFYNRFIASETDYKVYEQNGLRGWDIAFYKPRDLYHTGKDTVQYTGKDALWHMLNTALQLSKYVALDYASEAQNLLEEPKYATPAVYFDVVGKFFFVIPAKQLFLWNVLLLAILPMILILLAIVCKRRGAWKMSALGSFLRLPFAVLTSFTFMLFTKRLLMQLNPTVWSRNFYVPLLTFFSESLLLNYAILAFFEYLWPLQDFKTLAILELSVIIWVVLVKITWDLKQSAFKNTGVYPLTIVYCCISVAAMFGLLVMSFNKTDDVEDEVLDHDPVSHTSATSGNSVVISQEITESSPLIHTPESSIQSCSADSIETRSHMLTTKRGIRLLKKTLNYDWSIQYILLTPLASFIIYQSLISILDALAMTVQESSVATNSLLRFVLGGTILLTVPLLPFVQMLNRFVVYLLLVIAISTSLWSFSSPPYTETSPLKLRFVQRIDLSRDTQQQVEIFGRTGADLKSALNSLPSKPEVFCEPAGYGTEKCSYQGIWPNIGIPMNIKVSSNSRDDKNHAEYEPYVANLRIDVVDNRNCVLKFNTTGKKLLKQVEFSIESENKSYSYKTDEGIDSLLLHKLDWNSSFYDVKLKWIPHFSDEESLDLLGVSVDCYWGEYDDTIVDNKIVQKVPAYNELLHYLPKKYIVSNKESGIVTVHKYLEL